jgi:sugar/nucleoside kinase (ribokinase family)
MFDVLAVGAVFREVVERADGQTSRVRLGGSAYTAAAAAARLGGSVGLAALVGSADSRYVRASLEPLGVDCSLVVETEGSSGVFVVDDDRGAPRPTFRPSAPARVALPPLPEAQIVLVFGVPGFDVSRWLFKADLRNALLLWDRQGWLSLTDTAAIASIKAPRRFYLANLSEAVAELSPENPDALRRMLPPVGFEVAVIKDGCWGVSVVGEQFSFETPAFHVKLASEIGSGDAFAGALAAGLAGGKRLQDAVLEAAGAAAIVIETGDNILPRETLDRISRLIENGDASRVPPYQRRGLRVTIDAQPTGGGALVVRELTRLLAPLGVRLVPKGECTDLIVSVDQPPEVGRETVVVTTTGDPDALDRALRAARDDVVSWVRTSVHHATERDRLS